jgi:hypothetical protein
MILVVNPADKLGNIKDAINSTKESVESNDD